MHPEHFVGVRPEDRTLGARRLRHGHESGFAPVRDARQVLGCYSRNRAQTQRPRERDALTRSEINTPNTRRQRGAPSRRAAASLSGGLFTSVGLDGLQLEDKQHLSPLAHRWGSEAESEEDSLLVAEDDPTPGFECIDKAMLRARRQVVLMSRRHRAVLCLAVTAAAWLLFSAPSYLFGRRCSRSMPRIFSHRGLDASEALYEVTSQRSLRDLLDGGLRSFDLDLFWTAHDPEGAPHPTPNPRHGWPPLPPHAPRPDLASGRHNVRGPPAHSAAAVHLPADLVRTPLEELRARHEVKLLSLQELLRLLKRRQRALDQVLAR